MSPLLRVVLAALLATTLGVVLAPTPSAGASPSGAAAARDDDRAAGRMVLSGRALDVDPVAPGIVGGNQRWLDQADGAWDPRARRLRGDVADLLRRVGTGSIRYAGGTVANLFDHRRSLGRPRCQTSGGFAAPFFAPIPARRSGYTIARHADFAARVGAATSLMVPMINTTVDRAVDFVRSMVAATGQRRIVVELGNEPYGDLQRYWRSPDPDARLTQYIDGGSRRQTGDLGARALYPATGCDLLHPARADGSRDQTYRPRYTPIATDRPLSVRVGDRRWRYVPDLAAAGPRDRVFTVAGDERVVFGDGVHGARPRGAMSIDYVAGPMPGYADFYPALKALEASDGLDISVCSSWASESFARRMDARGLAYDCLAPHLYANIRGVTGTRESFRRFMRAATLRNAAMVRLRRTMRSSPVAGARDRFLAVTEFGGTNRSRPAQGGQFMNDLMLAVELAGQVRTGVRVSALSNLNTFLDRYGETFRPSTAAYLESLVGRMVGQQPVEVDGVPAGLAVVGSRAGRRGSLLVVSRRWSGERRVRLVAGGRGGPSCVAVRTLLDGPGDVTRPRRPSVPDAVRRPSARAWRGPALPVSFPAHSVTLLTYRPLGDGACRRPSFL